MSLPQAVAAQEELADRLYREAYSETPPADDTSATPPADAAPAAPAAPAQPPSETWEARYKTLAGKYNAEVPALNRRAQEAEAKVNDLTAKLTDATKRLDALEAKAKQQPLVKPEEVQEFGEPLVDLVRRAAREEIAQHAPPAANGDIETLRGELKELKTVAAQTAEQQFFARLTELVSDWTVVNADPTFHEWLSKKAPFSRLDRQTLLSEAQAALDAEGVAEFFTAFKGEAQARATEAQSQIEQQVVPSSQTRAAAPLGKVVFTRTEIARFYADWRAGRIDDAAAVAKDVEIQKALREGRVR